MHSYQMTVKFEDVDAAGIVFFPRFFSYAHDAMTSLFDDLDGGYARLVNQRRIGLPAVHASSDFKSPLRFGDRVRIAVTTTRIGSKSATLRYDFRHIEEDRHVATLSITTVSTEIDPMKSIQLPSDVRAALEKHLVSA